MLRGDERREGAQDEDGGATIEAIVLATASGAGPQEIVARLADALGCSCALVDAQGALCASAGTAPADAELDAVAAHAAGGGGALLAWRRFPVLAVRRVEGHLLVRRDGAAFGARERTILAAALPSLALALQARGGTTAAPAPAAAPADPVPPRPVADGLRASLLAAQPPETLRGLTGRLIDPVVAWDARRGTDLVGTLRAFLDADGRRASLLAAQPPETLRGLTGRLIDPVVAWDARRGTDLVGTLRAFLDADGRWDLTAAHLGVHVNTVRNRLGRIEELTGTDVALLADRVDFVLALEAQDLLGAR